VLVLRKYHNFGYDVVSAESVGPGPSCSGFAVEERGNTEGREGCDGPWDGIWSGTCRRRGCLLGYRL
jgi:hypothetical protein